VRFDEGDSELLPYEDASFDAVISMFGMMFAPRPELAASEIARVCRDGGLVALATWTPEGFVGQMFKTIGRHVPPPAIMASPIKWGEDATVRERLTDVEDLRLTRRLITFQFPMPVPEVVEFWRVFYGPMNRAFDALSAFPDKHAALRADLEQLWATHNALTDGTTQVDSEYLETIGTRRRSRVTADAPSDASARLSPAG
jgi:SAM-dependent methyltransferase